MSIKLNAFMTAYKFRKTAEEKEEIVKSHINNEYIPFEQKVAVAQAIVDNCYWKNEKTVDGNDNRVLHIDSISKYMLTYMAVVKLFTDIECHTGEGKMLDDFNILNSAGILDLIIDNVNQKDLNEFKKILELACDDIINNEFENHAYITKQVNRFVELFNVAIAPMISQLDISKIKEVVEQF